MDHVIAERRLLAKRGESLIPTSVVIFRPYLENKMHVCRVHFDIDTMFDAYIRGSDEFSAIDCAIAYVESICINSEDPEFYWIDGESMKGSS